MARRSLLMAVAIVLIAGIAMYLHQGAGEASIDTAQAHAADTVPASDSAEVGKAPARPAPPLRASPNHFLDYFLATKARAEAGEAIAQRDLADIYGRCMLVNINPQKFLQSIDAITALSKSPADAKEMKRVASATTEECAVVDNGAIIPIEARDLWLAQAAKQGDLVAQARLFMAPGNRPHGDDLRRFMDQVVTSGDPAALFDLGQLVAGNSSGEGTGIYASVAGDPLSGYAWSIVACRRGLDCSAGSPLMTSLCLNTGACSSPSFESFVRDYLVTSGDAPLLDSKVQAVNALLPDAI